MPLFREAERSWLVYERTIVEHPRRQRPVATGSPYNVQVVGCAGLLTARSAGSRTYASQLSDPDAAVRPGSDYLVRDPRQWEARRCSRTRIRRVLIVAIPGPHRIVDPGHFLDGQRSRPIPCEPLKLRNPPAPSRKPLLLERAPASRLDAVLARAVLGCG